MLQENLNSDAFLQSAVFMILGIYTFKKYAHDKKAKITRFFPLYILLLKK